MVGFFKKNNDEDSVSLDVKSKGFNLMIKGITKPSISAVNFAVKIISTGIAISFVILASRHSSSERDD